MNDLLNFHQATDSIGTSGQPTREQFTDIANQGYTSVVNLAMPDSDNAIPEEGSVVSALGMAYFHIPVPFEAPTAEHVKKFIRVMQALEGEKVFVHCAVNARVSAFMYKYLTVYKSKSEEESTSPVLKVWSAKMDARWKAIIDLSADDLAV